MVSSQYHVLSSPVKCSGEKKHEGQLTDRCHIDIIHSFHTPCAKLVSSDIHVRLKTTDVCTLCDLLCYIIPINVTVT